jgi:DivIVA domain-containing protein
MLPVVVLEVIVIAVVLFAVAAVIAGLGGNMVEFAPDRPVLGLPDDRLLTADDVDELRFPLAVRGYRMADVDEALDRIADTLRTRDAEVAVLRAEVTAARDERS